MRAISSSYLPVWEAGSLSQQGSVLYGTLLRSTKCPFFTWKDPVITSISWKKSQLRFLRTEDSYETLRGYFPVKVPRGILKISVCNGWVLPSLTPFWLCRPEWEYKRAVCMYVCVRDVCHAWNTDPTTTSPQSIQVDTRRKVKACVWRGGSGSRRVRASLMHGSYHH